MRTSWDYHSTLNQLLYPEQVKAQNVGERLFLEYDVFL